MSSLASSMLRLRPRRSPRSLFRQLLGRPPHRAPVAPTAGPRTSPHALPWGSLLLLLLASGATPLDSATAQGAPPELQRDSTVAPDSWVGPTLIDRYGMIGLGVLAASVGNQVIASPAGWPRTVGGYGSRLGDQVGFAAVEESVRAGLQASLKWKADDVPCAWQRSATPASAGLRARIACAARQTATLRTSDGAPRPNLPFLAGVVTGAAASATWRPERSDPVKARAMVATRIGIVLGSSVAKRVGTTWWDDRRGARYRREDPPDGSAPKYRTFGASERATPMSGTPSASKSAIAMP